eukprot:TRINITY_DN64257_c0_g3_i1.p1 TRINITY_DN64257_c0_g3~~TRINITY_DN64257_c0_g3_i1.p1  ORF type:complete len:105 (+),score=8.70 TRINITY_DN64257_c0_g3_i1:171-485(+)
MLTSGWNSITVQCRSEDAKPNRLHEERASLQHSSSTQALRCLGWVGVNACSSHKSWHTTTSSPADTPLHQPRFIPGKRQKPWSADQVFHQPVCSSPLKPAATVI